MKAKHPGTGSLDLKRFFRRSAQTLRAAGTWRLLQRSFVGVENPLKRGAKESTSSPAFSRLQGRQWRLKS